MVFGKITSLNRKRVSLLLNRVLDKLQRFVVTFAVKIMRQARIGRLRKGRLQLFDLFRDGAQSRDVRVRIPAAFFVADDCETLAQSFFKIDNGLFHWFKNRGLHRLTRIEKQRFPISDLIRTHP